MTRYMPDRFRYDICDSKKFCVKDKHGFIDKDFILKSLLYEYKTPIKSFIIALLLNSYYIEKASEYEKAIMQALYHDGGCCYSVDHYAIYNTYRCALNDIVNEIPGLSYVIKLRRYNGGDYNIIQFNLDNKIFTPEYKRNLVSLAKLKGIINVV